MQVEESAAWLSGLFDAPLEFRQFNEHTLGLIEAEPAVAITTAFNQVDTGLALEDDTSTAVRAELIAFSQTNAAAAASVVLAAADYLAQMQGVIPAQPGVFLPDLVEKAGLKDVEVRHGLLRAPVYWDKGVPQFQEPGQLTLVLEVVLLTEDEFEIGREQGVDKLERRMRRRGTDELDWLRS